MTTDSTVTMAWVRTTMAKEIDKLQNDGTTPQKVNAVVNATRTILSSVKLEMEYFKLIGKTPNIPLMMLDEVPKVEDA